MATRVSCGDADITKSFDIKTPRRASPGAGARHPDAPLRAVRNGRKGPATLGYVRHHAMQTSQYTNSRPRPDFHPGAWRGSSIFLCCLCFITVLLLLPSCWAQIDEAAESHVHHQAQSQEYKQRGRSAVAH